MTRIKTTKTTASLTQPEGPNISRYFSDIAVKWSIQKTTVCITSTDEDHGHRHTLITPAQCRRLADWLYGAADELDKRKGQ